MYEDDWKAWELKLELIEEQDTTLFMRYRPKSCIPPFLDPIYCPYKIAFEEN